MYCESIAFASSLSILSLSIMNFSCSRLFTDIRFISRVKQEFIEGELALGMKEQFDEADRLFIEGV